MTSCFAVFLAVRLYAINHADFDDAWLKVYGREPEKFVFNEPPLGVSREYDD